MKQCITESQLNVFLFDGSQGGAILKKKKSFSFSLFLKDHHVTAVSDGFFFDEKLGNEDENQSTDTNEIQKYT